MEATLEATTEATVRNAQNARNAQNGYHTTRGSSRGNEKGNEQNAQNAKNTFLYFKKPSFLLRTSCTTCGACGLPFGAFTCKRVQG